MFSFKIGIGITVALQVGETKQKLRKEKIYETQRSEKKKNLISLRNKLKKLYLLKVFLLKSSQLHLWIKNALFCASRSLRFFTFFSSISTYVLSTVAKAKQKQKGFFRPLFWVYISYVRARKYYAYSTIYNQ